MSQHDAVQKLIEQYIEGTRRCDVTILESVFHTNARMHGYLADQLMSGGPEPFYQAIAAVDAQGHEDYQAQIVAVDVNGAIATATINEQALLGMNFINHFQLLFEQDQWLIVSKLFQGSPRV